jgi:hypothetical protein
MQVGDWSYEVGMSKQNRRTHVAFVRSGQGSKGVLAAGQVFGSGQGVHSCRG